MSRYIEYEPLMSELEREVELADDWKTAHEIANVAKYAPTIEAVPKDFHDKTCEAMAKRHTEEIQRLMPKQGKWKHGDMGVGYYEYPCCSKCGYETEEETNFCPNCGADMRGENNETDKEMR